MIVLTMGQCSAPCIYPFEKKACQLLSIKFAAIYRENERELPSFSFLRKCLIKIFYFHFSFANILIILMN